LLCFGGVRVGQSFVLFWWGSCGAIFCFVLVGFVQKIAQHEPH
jgi:hypothetical protein